MPHDEADRVARLVRLRDRLADEIEGASARDLAPLAARYQSVLAELSDLAGVSSSDGFDDLAARRERNADAAGF